MLMVALGTETDWTGFGWLHQFKRSARGMKPPSCQAVTAAVPLTFGQTSYLNLRRSMRCTIDGGAGEVWS